MLFGIRSWFGYNQSTSAMCIYTSSMDRRASNTNTPATVVQSIIVISNSISSSSRCRPLFTASIPAQVSSHEFQLHSQPPPHVLSSLPFSCKAVEMDNWRQSIMSEVECNKATRLSQSSSSYTLAMRGLFVNHLLNARSAVLCSYT